MCIANIQIPFSTRLIFELLMLLLLLHKKYSIRRSVAISVPFSRIVTAEPESANLDNM